MNQNNTAHLSREATAGLFLLIWIASTLTGGIIGFCLASELAEEPRRAAIISQVEIGSDQAQLREEIERLRTASETMKQGLSRITILCGKGTGYEL